VTRRTRSRTVFRALGAAASAVLMPVGVLGVSAAAMVAGSTGTPGGGWASGLWMGGGGTVVGTTIKDIRTIINASTGTAGALNGTGVGVALIDTGVAPVPGMPAGQLVNGPDLSFESQTSNLRYLDSYGHGTHMAGIIIGNDTATGTVGLAPKSKLTSIKVGAANGSVDVTQVIAAIDWVVEHRRHDPAYPIRVINLAYGTAGTADYRTDPVQFAIEQAWRVGIVVVVAGGNEGNGTTSLTLPATDPFVLSVGASSTKGTTATDDDTLASFSNLGKVRNVDLLAPGESIVSLRNPGSNIDEVYPTARVGDTLFRGSGSSQAAAVTSAAAALLLQNRPSLTPDQVKRILIDSGTPLALGTANTLGLRQLNVGAALTRATPTTVQSFTRSNGTGSIESSRGNGHVIVDNVALKGENSVMGPFSSSTWAGKAATESSWVGGLWMGKRLAGQQWAGPGGPGGTGQILAPNGTCLDAWSGQTVNGTPVITYTCHGQPNQYWQMHSDGTIRITGKCMDADGRTAGAGAKIQLWDCNGSARQKWQLNDKRQVVLVGLNLCLDTNWSPTLYALKTEVCNDSSSQRYMLPFASKTWSAGTWDGKPWSGAASWSDPSWAGRYWSGRYWSGRYWSGRYWSSEDWATSSWG